MGQVIYIYGLFIILVVYLHFKFKSNLRCIGDMIISNNKANAKMIEIVLKEIRKESK